MIHIGLFEGIGGFSIAARMMGWDTLATCEIADFPHNVLKYHWPNSYHHRDIHDFNFEKLDYELKKRYGNKWRSDDIILTGGFPCQPYSSAGKRLGKEDDRHLWPEMLRVIRDIKPRFVVGENVSGIISWNEGLVFNEVQTDLEAEGYEVQPVLLPACAVNAPHRRDRIWFVAYSNECTKRPPRASGKAEINGCKNNDEQISRRKQAEQHSGCSDVYGANTNTDCSMRERRSIGNESKEREKPNEKQFRRHYELSKTNFQEFPSKPPLCSGDDGLSNRLDGITFSKWRNESIKAYGNAIVPQVAYNIFKAITQTNKQNGISN